MSRVPLFSSKMSYTYFDRLIDGLRRAALSMTLDSLADEAKAIISLREKFEVSRIELQLDNMEKPTVDEDDHRRPRVTIVVPVCGDSHTPSILEMMPSKATGTPPVGEVQSFRSNSPTSIKLEYISETREVDSDAVKRWRQRCLSDLELWVGWMNDDIDVFYNHVAQEASKLVPKRKAEHAALQRLRDDLS